MNVATVAVMVVDRSSEWEREGGKSVNKKNIYITNCYYDLSVLNYMNYIPLRLPPLVVSYYYYNL